MEKEVKRSSTSLEVIRGRPVEVLVSLMCIGLGIYLTVDGSKASPVGVSTVTVGSVLTAAGGILASWVYSSAIGRLEARAEIHEQLEAVSRNIGQAAGQIQRTADAASVGDLGESTGLALIRQAAESIAGQVDHLQNLTGTPFDPSRMIGTLDEIDNLARVLEDRRGQGGTQEQATEEDAASEIRELVREFRGDLARSTAPPVVSASVSVNCPECGVGNTLELGLHPGATQLQTCTGCRRRFNVHRVSEGNVITRKAPMSTGAPMAEGTVALHLTCPDCGNSISVPVKEGTGVKSLVCWECHSCLEANVVDRTVRVTGRFTECENQPVVGGREGRPLVRCPGRCDRDLKAMFRWGDDAFAALCFDDLLILPALKTEWERFRAADLSTGFHAVPMPPTINLLPVPAGIQERVEESASEAQGQIDA